MDDVHGWLEDVEGEAALEWVRAMNARTEGSLFVEKTFDTMRGEILEILEADDRIPVPSRVGDDVLNFWTDASHRRGVLRRMTWDAYRAGSDVWETVIDVDALGAADGVSWVFHGVSVRRPDRRRMLVDLSPGGSDASVTREFDLVDLRFIPPEEGGFERPLAKGSLTWIDDDTVYARTDFGPGTLTDSGYPRTIRRWSRGTRLEDAPVVFEGEATDVSVSVVVEHLPGFEHHVFHRAIDFFNTREWILRDGALVEIAVPTDAGVRVRDRWLAVEPRKDWQVDGRTFPAGSLLVADLEDFLGGDRDLTVVFEPTETSALSMVIWTRHQVMLRIHEDVRDRIEIASPDTGWARRVLDTPPPWTLEVQSFGADETDDSLLVGNDFLTPPTLYYTPAGGEPTVLRSSPNRFDPSGLAITQSFVASTDGTRIPYFVVGPATGVTGPAPTLLSGYGGFEVARSALYSGIVGRAWLARGGVYVVANIRGGGEYGPRWHQAGLRENRHRVYEDFEAVARDLVARGITTPAQMGISGGSNGGLLVGNMYVRSPELFGAIVCQVPLLDMKRYPHLLAGASWMAEYGDPDDPADWDFIRTFSPYHLIESGRPYPPLLLTTSTRDDRVHPGHARKMAAALTALGYDVDYWENIEGGHGGAADAPQQATMQALAFTFLGRHLMG